MKNISACILDYFHISISVQAGFFNLGLILQKSNCRTLAEKNFIVTAKILCHKIMYECVGQKVILFIDKRGHPFLLLTSE